MSLAGKRILIADDLPDVREALRLLLKAEGARTAAVDSPDAVIRTLESEQFDAVLMDLNYTRDTTSGTEGLDTLTRLRQIPALPPVVVMTAWGSMELAVEAVRRGAADFVMKPWENDRLVATLVKRLQESRPDQREEDLALARRVQSRLLPNATPQIPGLLAAAHCSQVRAIGGDFYDFVPLASGRTLIVAGDASGKGVAAALLMANLQGAFRGLRDELDRDLGAGLGRMSADLLAATLPEQYVVAFAGIWDPSTARLDYINAGGSPPMWLRNSFVSRLEANAPPLGLLPDFAATPATVRLSTGETLLLFSDGVDEYGEERLAADLTFGAELAPPVLVAELAALIAREAPRTDDLTLIALRRA